MISKPNAMWFKGVGFSLNIYKHVQSARIHDNNYLKLFYDVKFLHTRGIVQIERKPMSCETIKKILFLVWPNRKNTLLDVNVQTVKRRILG